MLDLKFWRILIYGFEIWKNKLLRHYTFPSAQVYTSDSAPNSVGASLKILDTAIGYTGATAIDCTLSIIQKAGGVEVLPLAFSFGFITNIAPPILLVFFTSVPL